MKNEKLKKFKKFLIEFISITFGVFLLAIGITVFYEPHDLVTGGVSGIAIIISNIAESHYNMIIPLWFTNIALNIPLFLIGLKIKGFKFLTKTIYATFLLSFFFFLIDYFPVVETDLLLASIYGGAFSGLGLGFVFRGFATTGGTDLLAAIINHYKAHISLSKGVFYLDSFVVLLGFFVFGFEKAMYAIIAVYITSKAIEAILEGMNFSKAVFIISNESDKIAKLIQSELDRGVTGLNGKGMYEKKESTILLAVVSVKEMAKLKQVVRQADENSFVIVADVREVLGEGFESFS